MAELGAFDKFEFLEAFGIQATYQGTLWGQLTCKTKTQIIKIRLIRKKKTKKRQRIVIQSKAKKHITQVIQDYYKVKSHGVYNLTEFIHVEMLDEDTTSIEPLIHE